MKPILIALAFAVSIAAQPARLTPSVIMSPGAEFQDDVRGGAMIIGMDRTPKGRIWGC